MTGQKIAHSPDELEDMANRTKEVSEMDVDEFLEKIGQYGLMQKLYVFIFCLLIIPSTYQTLIMSFIGNSPDWKCVSNNTECNMTDILPKTDKRRCDMNRTAWEYTKQTSFSIVTEWDLICSDDYISFLVNSAMFIGWAFGATILGWISDKYGRKITLYPSFTVCILCSFLMSFANSIWWVFVLRVFMGFAQGGIGLTLFVMASELVGPKYRSFAGTTVWVAFTLALCLMALQAYFVQEWRRLLQISSIPYIILLPTYFLVPESVRWLRLNGRIEEAEQILRKVAHRNKQPWPNAKLSAPATTSEVVSAKYLFVPTKMCISTLIQVFAWFSVSLVYYGISLASDNLGGSMYRDFVLTSVVEIPANILAMFTLNIFGRRPTTCGNWVISGVSCMGVAFIPTHGVYNWIRVAFGMLGKLCVTLAFSALFVWSVELYPTVIRSQGMGLMNVVSRIGGASAPWVAQYLGNFNKYLPFLVMGSLSLISAALCYKLYETTGMALAETLEDFNQSDSKESKTMTTIIENDFTKEDEKDQKENTSV